MTLDLPRSDSAVDMYDDNASTMSDDVRAHLISSEEVPLLATDLPPDVLPDKKFRRYVMGMMIASLIVIEICQFIMEPPTQALMEDIICRDYFSDHRIGMLGVPDSRCKAKEVQKTLAMVRSWTTSLSMALPALVQIPFGIIADKYGRRMVLFLALFGAWLQTAWWCIVLWFPNVFSVWAMLYGCIPLLIGGGGQMAGAMLFTIFADVVPVASRTGVFYNVFAGILLLNAVVTPISAAVMSLDPWLAMWIGMAALTLGLVPAFLIPETLRLRQKADNKRRHERDEGFDGQDREGHEGPVKITRQSVVRQAWLGIRDDLGQISRCILGSKAVMSLILSYALYYPVKLVMMIYLLQYISRRFDWTWSEATYVSTAGSITSIVTLLVILPLASMYLTKRRKLEPLDRDLVLARISALVMVAGILAVAFANNSWLFVSSYVLYNVSWGFVALSRSLLSAIVEPHTLGAANTSISLLEVLIGMGVTPTMGWLFGKSFDLGGVWQGLPFMVTSVFAVALAAAIFFFRVPAAVAQHQT